MWWCVLFQPHAETTVTCGGRKTTNTSELNILGKRGGLGCWSPDLITISLWSCRHRISGTQVSYSSLLTLSVCLYPRVVLLQPGYPYLFSPDTVASVAHQLLQHFHSPVWLDPEGCFQGLTGVYSVHRALYSLFMMVF